MSVIKIDSELVERYLFELAKFGSWGDTGVWRPVYTPEWISARDQYISWCKEAGLSVHQDAVGNVWGRLDGNESGKSIVSGSHIDTQKPGGRYDGALGAIGALIAIRALREQFGQPRKTLEAVALCEEESSRFAANFWGSRAIIGGINPGDPDRIVNEDGESIAEAMRAIGLNPDRCEEAKRDDIEAFLELHIEQGPVLEQAELPVAVVSGIAGVRVYRVVLNGTANHAGAFPMDLRSDPMAGFVEIAQTLTENARQLGRPVVTTIGQVFAEPNGPTIIPSRVEFTVDARHVEPDAYHQLLASHEKVMRDIASKHRLGIELDWFIDHEPSPSDPNIVRVLQEGASEQGIPFMTMPSGAAHDAQQMAEIAKIGMVFVRSKDGRSHTPEEFSSVADMVAGIEVLASGLHKLAY